MSFSGYTRRWLLAFLLCYVMTALAGSNPNLDLINACHRGDLAKAEKALEQGADPNFVVNRYSPLIYAVHSGKPELVTLLVQGGADPEYQGPDGHSAIKIARLKNKKDLIEILEAKTFEGPTLEQIMKTLPLKIGAVIGLDSPCPQGFKILEKDLTKQPLVVNYSCDSSEEKGFVQKINLKIRAGRLASMELYMNPAHTAVGKNFDALRGFTNDRKLTFKEREDGTGELDFTYEPLVRGIVLAARPDADKAVRVVSLRFRSMIDQTVFDPKEPGICPSLVYQVQQGCEVFSGIESWYFSELKSGRVPKPQLANKAVQLVSLAELRLRESFRNLEGVNRQEAQTYVENWLKTAKRKEFWLSLSSTVK